VLLPLAAAPISRWKRGGGASLAVAVLDRLRGWLRRLVANADRDGETAQPGGPWPVERVDNMVLEGFFSLANCAVRVWSVLAPAGLALACRPAPAPWR
jgi:hypothetical protein